MPRKRIGEKQAPIKPTRKRRWDGQEFRRIALELPVDLIEDIDRQVTKANKKGHYAHMTRTGWIRRELTRRIAVEEEIQTEIPPEAYTEV